MRGCPRTRPSPPNTSMGRDRPARRRVRDDCCRCPTRPVGHPDSILQPDRGTGGRRRRVGGVRSVHRGTAPSGYQPSRPRHPAPARVFADADDIASVLRYWVARATARLAGSGRTRKAPQLITGLMASADGPMTDDMRPALGSAPRGPRKVATWRRHARTVAAYRDCYGITEDSPLGPDAGEYRAEDRPRPCSGRSGTRAGGHVFECVRFCSTSSGGQGPGGPTM